MTDSYATEPVRSKCKVCSKPIYRDANGKWWHATTTNYGKKRHIPEPNPNA